MKIRIIGIIRSIIKEKVGGHLTIVSKPQFFKDEKTYNLAEEIIQNGISIEPIVLTEKFHFDESFTSLILESKNKLLIIEADKIDKSSEYDIMSIEVSNDGE